MPLVFGLLLVAAGLAVLATPWTVGQLAVFAAVIFILRGMAVVLSALEGRLISGLDIVAGAVGVTAGIWLLAWPGPSLLVLSIFIGAWITVSGLFTTAAALVRRRDIPHWGLVLAVGAIEILLGAWAMRRPAFSLTLALTVVGFWAILIGALFCAVAVELRRLVRTVEDFRSAVYGSRLEDRRPTSSFDSPSSRLFRLNQSGLLTDEELAVLLGGASGSASSGRSR